MDIDSWLLAIAILVSGLMVGNELAVGAFVHPQIRRLNSTTEAEAGQAFAKIFGQVMPGWYAAVTALTLLVVWRLLPVDSSADYFAIAAAVLWIISIVYTLIGPVRINNEIVRWDLKSLPADWRVKRAMWDRLHAIRVIILIAAFACLVLSALLAERSARGV